MLPNSQTRNNLKQTILQTSFDRQIENTYQWQQKINKNRQLLLMMHKLQQVQQSVWGKFFRFQKSNAFIMFEDKFRFKQIFRLRIDDIIYIALLTTIAVVFAILPSQTTQSSLLGTYLVKAYRFMLAFLVTASIMWLVSTNGYRHIVFFMLCVVFPLLTMLTYMGIIPFDQIDNTTSIFGYLHILTLWIVYFALYLVYPLKQFIRNKIGSLYSYLFALSTLTLIIIWPLYSLIQQFSTNQQITFNFITQNKALIIAFLIIIIFSFHLLTHHTFFQGNLIQTKRILLLDFTKAQLIQALQQIALPVTNLQHKQVKQQSFLMQHFTAYSRIMSLIVFVFTTAIQLYVFIYISDNLSYIYSGIGIMIFCIGFLAYGCIMNLLPVSRQSVLYFFSLISFVPAAISPLYCTNCKITSVTFTFYQYIFVAIALPYTTIFWCVVRSLSRRRPFLKTNMLVILYIFIHIPLTLFIINNLGMISTDDTVAQIFNIIVIGIVGTVTAIGIIGCILWLCLSIKKLPKEQKTKSVPVNYNYYEQGSPMYVPYSKKKTFSLSWLSSLDIRNLSQLFNCIAFIVCELTTMYFFNQLSTTYASTNFVFSSTKYIIYTQFYVSFAYFTYSYSYIVFKYEDTSNYIILVSLALCGLFGVIFSYVYQQGTYYSFRVGGGVSLVIMAIGIGLHIVKSNNKDIMNFLSGVLIILIWIFLIIPYVIVLPIVSIFISSSQFGVFIYACILGTALLLIILVSVMSIVFNILMNKFQEQKKIKFMTQDVETYLREQGVQTEDQVLHILHQSFENRNQKYVFFMKRGYPIRLYKDQAEKDSIFKTVVYNHQILNRQVQAAKIEQEQKSQDYCWICLTCFCGVDQEEMDNKMEKIAQKNVLDEDQMQQLMPEDFFNKIFIKAIKKQDNGEKRKYVDMSKLYSSKSIILRHLTKTNKHLGEQFAMLKTKKNRKLANQIWHLIFVFLANEDDPPAKIIFNDFMIFCSIATPEISNNQLNEMFLDYSSNLWKGNNAIDIHDFSILVEELTQKKYSQMQVNQDTKYNFLIDSVYPNLCEYAQFQDIMNQRRVKTTKKSNLNNSSNIAPGSLFTQNYSTTRPGSQLTNFPNKAIQNVNMHSLSNEELESSPFIKSFQKHKNLFEKIINKKLKLNAKKAQMQQKKLVEPAKQQIIEPKKKQQKVEKSKSCKLIIYEKYQSCKTCCKKIQEQQTVIKRKNLKPWQYLAVESIRIMQQKHIQWRQQKKQKQYQFRLILNNIMIAIFKLADLYTYISITIENPATGWQSTRSFGGLFLDFRTQLYISFGVVLLCSGLGIKGITYIFQDRLGLTETRLPASFPHPMFFFTFIYKLLILSLFNTIIMTLLTTFMCNWTTASTTYSMILSSNDTPLQCFSAEHNIYIICSIIAIILYYPLSAYTMPNFQFSEKRLDLKYKSSYMIIYFQVNFIMAAGKILLSLMITNYNTIQTIQIVFQSINISCIALLGLMIIMLKPCLISWFNTVQFLVVWIGLVWNVLGLVLYLTNQWLICIIVASSVSGLSIIIIIIFIRKTYFGGAKVEDEVQAQDIQQLQLGWKYKKQYNMDLLKFGNQREKNKIQLRSENTDEKDSMP